MTATLIQKNGKFHVVLRYEKDGENRQKWFNAKLSIRGNKKNAERIKEKLIEEWEQILEGEADEDYIQKTTGENDSVLFADVLLEWLESKKDTVQITTYQGYALVIEGVLSPYFRKLSLGVDEVTEEDIATLYMQAQGAKGFFKGRKPLSANSICHYNTYLHQAFQFAIEQKKYGLKYNPVDAVKKPTKRPYRASVYNEHEIAELFDAFKDDPLFVAVALGAYYGLRRSEVVGLEWRAIDFVQKTITISQVAYCTMMRGQPRQEKIKMELKSKSSYRTLPLYPVVEQMLCEEKQKQYENKKLYKSQYKNSGFVCVNILGERLRLGYVSEHFQRVIKSKGLRQIRFHDLRHSCATILFNNNVQQRDVKDWLGHSSIATTDRYTHTTYANKLPVADKMNGIMPKIRL